MRSNRTPFCDVADLVSIAETLDGNGYTTISTESKSTVYCSIIDGVTRAEFYEAEKTGHMLSATIEVWEDDYTGQKLVDVNLKRYRVVRAYPTGHGTLELSCEEVIR